MEAVIQQSDSPSSVGGRDAFFAVYSLAGPTLQQATHEDGVGSSTAAGLRGYTRELALVVTDMDANTEQRLHLRKTVTQMLDKNLINEQGSVGFLRNLIPTAAPMTQTATAATATGKQLQSGGTFYAAILNPTASQPLLLCLISLYDTDDTFALFRSELDRCVRNLNRLAMMTPFPSTEFQRTLDVWYKDSFSYVVDAIVSFETEQLAAFLHACLLSKSFYCPSSFVESPFVRLFDILHPSAAAGGCTILGETEPRLSTMNNDAVIIQIDSHSSIRLSCSETNQFCLSWAAILRSLAQANNYIAVRQQLESTKVQLQQDLHNIGKVLELAATDNYSLYDAFTKIATHPNRDILLIHLLQDSGSKDLKEMLEVLYFYSQEISAIT